MHTVINDEAFLKKGFKISTDKSLLDFDMIYNYLSKESYWSKGIPVEKVKESIESSMCFGIYKDDKQIGFARVITDKAIFAYLCDVFILEDFRRLGLSKWLMQTILSHPDLQGLRRWLLATADAHGLYNQFGFTTINNPERWLGIYTPFKTDGEHK
ncbi:N-acetylglutamate synthase, GNAT family [Mucilaginibacter mallensis]|uniref:N-acetylglutamate synthase, GNAT family n=1 Tax=Mucilaginibacter mallensis TaxID=652787 RepID=A0A1H1WBU1_MUCMA|nr:MULTISPECIES: GNAT family N-acetyltransferase [Mucilaginibacter]MBB6136946.1 GNAT superfamily N-acetyltransferase [Mucilaginibacter sp. X5P1]SDS94788.1 N-acetylglutamate synthase, GNAT family [Mucilaginibacter mallensis]